MSDSMPTTIIPTYTGVSKNIKTRVLKTDFGDGYSQRTADGINVIIREYDLEYIGSNTNIDELVTHFVERAGYQSFTYTFTNETTERKWTCEEWTETSLSDSTKQLTATIKEVYDL